MALTATDLPEPVVPATSRCGMRARSATVGRPAMSLPSARVSGLADLSYSFERSSSDRKIISRLVLGISRPITDLPGITSTTRTDFTDRPRAMSLSSELIWLTLTPGAGSISKRVITGPGYAPTTCASMRKSLSLNSICRDRVCGSPRSSPWSAAWDRPAGPAAAARRRCRRCPNSGIWVSRLARSLFSTTGAAGGSIRTGSRRACRTASVLRTSSRSSRRSRVRFHSSACWVLRRIRSGNASTPAPIFSITQN